MAALVASLPLPDGPLAFYWPIRSEADPRPTVSRLTRPLCLPAVTAEGLAFRSWTKGDALTTGPFGLSEPSPQVELVMPATLIIPLAAFDRRGHRIGYGKGFYDRALADLPHARTIGLAFATQEIDFVPDEAHDRALDYVVTEREIIATRAT
jgi:5-formyltetrahydrofolate cyclo-ligase